MNILAIDTTGAPCSCAVLRDGKLVSSVYMNNKLTHSVNLMPIIDEALKLSDMNIKDMDVFAVTVGPGSFTGIRIGICTVKGFCMLTDKPAVAIDALDVLAEAVYDKNAYVVPMIDARRGQVYCAVYKDGRRLCEDKAEDVTALLRELEGRAVFTGDGAVSYREHIEKNYSEAEFACEPNVYQNAAYAAKIALKMYNENKTVSAEELAANYLKKTQAERERLEKEKNNA